MVEQNRGGAYTQIVYGPLGNKLALMNGRTLSKGFVGLPGGATAVYTWNNSSAVLSYYRHADWLGSSRLDSSSSQAVIYQVAYGPYGEPYDESGTTDRNFTGQNQDTVGDMYDFLYREYHEIQGRWILPDPAGLAAVDPTNPQSWNRYAYVTNNPLSLTDPKGLHLRNPGEWDDYGCTIDGFAVDCAEAAMQARAGAIAACPSNYCGAVSVGGVLVYFVAHQTGSTYAPYAGPGSMFDTNGQAVIAGAMNAENQSLLDNGNEQCGMAYSADDRFSYTAPVAGDRAGCQPLDASGSVPGGDIATGGYHSHGVYDPNYANDRFSGQPGDYPAGQPNGDVPWSNDHGFPLSVATPGGNVIVYYPGPGCQTFFLGGPFGTGTTIPICQ